MKFTASTTWSNAVTSISKGLKWSVYFRKTSVLNAALDTGTWTEITSRIQDLPDISTRFEFDVGQSASDTVRLTGVGLAYFRDNMFNATASEYIEIKILCAIGPTPTVLASDVCYMFAGFVDKLNVLYNELADTAEFSAYTADDLAGRFSAETLNTQYIDTDVDGSGTDGVFLDRLKTLYVTNCNVSSYVLEIGRHSISYQLDGSNHQARLDGGKWVTLATGSNTLGNHSENTALDTERVTVYVKSTSGLPGVDTTAEFIVTTKGDTLPKQWYQYITVRQLISKIYSKVGIDSVTFDDLEIGTYNSAGRLQLLDTPGDGSVLSQYNFATVAVGSDLWVAYDNKVYSRDLTTGVYTLKITLSDSTSRISKLLYNSRNGHVWVFYGKSGNLNGMLRRYIVSSDTLSSEISLSTTADYTRSYSIDVVDFNYTGSSWKYGVIYSLVGGGSGNGSIRWVDGSSLADSELFTTWSDEVITSNFGYRLGSDAWRATIIYFTYYGEHNYYINSSGTWVDGDVKLTDGSTYGLDQYNVATFDSTNGRIYYRTINVTPDKIRSHTSASTTTTDHLTLAANDYVQCLYYGNSLAYFTVGISGGTNKLYSISGTSSAVELASDISARWGGMTYTNNRLYIASSQIVNGPSCNYGRLYQFGPYYTLTVQEARVEEGGSLRDLLSSVLSAFMVLATIRMNKTGVVYKRCDKTGAIVTSGNSLSIGPSSAVTLIQTVGHIDKCDLVRVRTQGNQIAYDGTNWTADAWAADKRIVEIESDYIDPTFIRDVAYQAYNFFKTAHDIYSLDLFAFPAFQYELSDGVTLNFSTTRIQKSATGLIYELTYRRDGSMTIGGFY